MVFTGLSTYICRYAERNISCEKYSDIGVYSLLYLLGVSFVFLPLWVSGPANICLSNNILH